MPGRRRDQVPIDNSLCRRCQADQPTITIRTEPLCTACFIKYVSSKAVKRMESFRVRNAAPNSQRTLLLPLSFGPCSLALLHTLNDHLQGQLQKSGRTGYSLHILHVNIDNDDELTSHLVKKIKAKYPNHKYSTTDLLSPPLLQDPSLSHILPLAPDSLPISLNSLLSSLPTPTSRTDILQILLRKQIQLFAASTACEAILWAHSTTRLAESTLAETAKGRGSSIPYTIADGFSIPSTNGRKTTTTSVPSYYPLRDLLRKEIISFAGMVEPSLDGLIPPSEKEGSLVKNRGVVKKAAPVSTKNTTIDELMRQYFESVENEYPSIVTNVVRTTGKLRGLEVHEVEARCEVCEMPLEVRGAPERSRLCYGCIRTLGGDVEA